MYLKCDLTSLVKWIIQGQSQKQGGIWGQWQACHSYNEYKYIYGDVLLDTTQ